jgi:Uma2 family endonuclease
MAISAETSWLVPGLAVEIHAKDGASRDRVRKFGVYQKAGLPWYWLVDYAAAVIEEYHLVRGRYVRTAGAGPGDEFQPQALKGLVIPVDALL